MSSFGEATATRFTPIGLNFTKGRTRIARQILPQGTVAHLTNETLLQLAIEDLVVYATQSETIKPRYTIAFRMIDEQECEWINHRLMDLFGVRQFAARSQEFCPSIGHLHAIDNEHIAHITKRHGVGATKVKAGQLPISAADFRRVPWLTQPRHIREFSITDQMPRIVYAQDVEGSELVAIEEWRRGRGVLVLKTLYRKK